MGIEIKKKIKLISEAEFHKLDYKIMGLVFQVHNELGKFCNEKICQNYLAHLCKENGINSVDTEVPIVVSFENFIKKFYIDILINNTIIYELKSVNSINNEHKRQALNYLLLAGINHGKIINFGTTSIEFEFISTSLTQDSRYNVSLRTDKWINTDIDSKWLKELTINLLKEWGTFLGVQLFYDAILFFRGGKENVVRSIKITCDDLVVGTQNFYLLNNHTAFNLSAMTKDKRFYRKHLEQFLTHTSLDTIQWINFNHHNIEFETIIK